MDINELKIIRRALGLLIPTNKMQAQASGEAVQIVDREIKVAEKSKQEEMPSGMVWKTDQELPTGV